MFANGGWYREITPIVKMEQRMEDDTGRATYSVIYETNKDASKKAALTFSE